MGKNSLLELGKAMIFTLALMILESEKRSVQLRELFYIVIE